MIKDFLLQLVFPRRCPVCDDIVTPFGEKICLECLKKLQVVTPPWCVKCGKKLLKEAAFCEDCKKGEHVFQRGRSLYEYQTVSPCVYRYKYRHRQEYADFFGEEMVRFLGDFLKRVRPDFLVPVPLHKTRERQRGYNQALVLAEAISKYSGIPCKKRVVKRIKATAPMKLLTPLERQNNLKKAFIVCENDVKFKTIMIIDDIYTTGATMDALSSLFLEAGARDVYFVTLSCGASV